MNIKPRIIQGGHDNMIDNFALLDVWDKNTSIKIQWLLLKSMQIYESISNQERIYSRSSGGGLFPSNFNRFLY